MTDQESTAVHRASFTCFPDAATNEPGLAAVLFTRDEHGNVRSYVKEYPGHQGPDPEIVAMTAQSVAIRNL